MCSRLKIQPDENYFTNIIFFTAISSSIIFWQLRGNDDDILGEGKRRLFMEKRVLAFEASRKLLLEVRYSAGVKVGSKMCQIRLGASTTWFPVCFSLSLQWFLSSKISNEVESSCSISWETGLILDKLEPWLAVASAWAHSPTIIIKRINEWRPRWASAKKLTCPSEIEAPQLPLVSVSRTILWVGPKGDVWIVMIHNQADTEPFMRRFSSGDDHVVAPYFVGCCCPSRIVAGLSRQTLQGLNLAWKCVLTPLAALD